MYGVENRFKISFSLGLKGVPLYREIPATKNHLSDSGESNALSHQHLMEMPGSRKHQVVLRSLVRRFTVGPIKGICKKSFLRLKTPVSLSLF